MDTGKQLISMKEKIDEAKGNVARMEGRKEQLYETLKKDFECKTLKEAEKKLISMNKELDKKEAALKNGITALENEYEWN